MPLYRVVFTEHGGSRYACQLRAAAVADHIALAVKQIWGPACYWTWVPGSDTEGQVYEQYRQEPSPADFPRTGRTTVAIAPARRRAVPYGVR